jgi:chloride channel protein, CIC family
LNDNQSNHNPLSPFVIFLLAILVGIVAGFGAVAFRALIAFFHNLLFLGQLSLVYDANLHTPESPWGPFVIFVPVVGAILVTFLVQHFAPEAKGHGVPEVMDAVYYHQGRIRPVVAAIKSLASALSIGSGGSVGREGPIVQIGSSFGSTLGQVIPMPTWQRITLIGAGTGGGIAATFNTPIGGILFAIELMLHEVSVRTLVPVAISTATATYIGRFFFGPNPSFVIPAFETPYFHLENPLVLLAYCGLGLVIGGASALYIRSIYAFEDAFESAIKKNPYVRHVIGMLMVGITFYILKVYLGHYYTEGVGYAPIQDIFTGTLSNGYILFLLFVLKLLATSLTLGSGASGGIFSPALFLGATLGSSYGVLLHHIFPSMNISPPAFAVVGMAGLAGSATGAAVTAVVMIFEMTLDYNVILPMTITVALSYGIRTLISRESIYSLKLVRRGHYVPEALQTAFHQVLRAKNLMNPHVSVISASSSLEEVSSELSKREEHSLLLVEDTNRQVIGVIRGSLTAETSNVEGKSFTASDIMDRKYVVIRQESSLLGIVAAMHRRGASIALATDDGTEDSGHVKGFITSEEIGVALEQSLELYPQ